MAKGSVAKCPIVRRDLQSAELTESILRHIVSTLGYDCERAGVENIYRGLSYALRDQLIEGWIRTQQSFYAQKAKRVYYVSLEFLPGPFLKNAILNLGLEDTVRKSLSEFGYSLEEVAEQEPEPGLGNGGLGRLASCYVDSMATLKIPGYGYGIRYSYGIFEQAIENGYQVEQADNWLRTKNIWEFDRPGFLYRVRFGGRVHEWTDEKGRHRHAWVDADIVRAMACDVLIPGYKNGFVTNMRLWAAKSSKGFNLDYFNTGDFVGAMQNKIKSENISMVLYPNDESDEGKELRFKQQYFLVSATMQDIMRRHKKSDKAMDHLPNEVCIQLNETHPAIAIPELMRLLLDTELMDWDRAWKICQGVFAYTNHTVLPEALEKWPLDLVERLLPRHMQIIYEINRRHLETVREAYPGDEERLGRMSLIEEGPVRYVRMAYMAIIGSRKVNGVAALHTDIIKKTIFKDFCEMYPKRFLNKTNGVTPRRFLKQCNPALANLIDATIGEGWVTKLDELKKLEPFAEKADFREKWIAIRNQNKELLAEYIREKTFHEINPDSLFDMQFKRIHEYKRQLLNVLHCITLYNRIKADPESVKAPRTVLFGGKAAPGYWMAKLIIKLINAVADKVNNDHYVGDKLKVVFLPNYNVTMAEKLFPAADLSEQISTAGMEASGTGNMKFAINGALTIGTLDGANVEMREEIGAENFFIFGKTADEVAQLRAGGYDPYHIYEMNHELRQVIDMIGSGHFTPENRDLFKPIVDVLIHHGDWFLLLADYEDYLRAQQEVSDLYLDKHAWTRKSILNTARMGKFSSDRSVMEYVKEIWETEPVGNGS